MIKTPVKFQKDRSKTVGGVALYKLRTMNHTSRKAEYHVPLLFFEKAGTINLCLENQLFFNNVLADPHNFHKIKPAKQETVIYNINNQSERSL